MRRWILVLLFFLTYVGQLDAANLYSNTSGNITAASFVTGNTGTNAVLISTSGGVTTLTTGNLDSATFTPAAQSSQYLAIRVASRAAGSPSNKMTIILRNSTSGTNIWTFVINVSDIPVCSTANDECGWLVFKNSSTHTPNGTDTYVVRATLDSTSTAVQLSTNGTANNWQRQLFQSATATPAAGDDMLIGGWWDTTNPAVKTDVTVTMNQTAATDYGSANTNIRVAAINVVKGGTLTYGSSASTNYLMQLSGSLVIFSGGTVNIGTSGTPIPRTSTATLQFDCAADLDFGLVNRGTLNAYGVSRIAASNTPWVLLSADAAAAATTINTVGQLSAANGDTVVLTSDHGNASLTDSRTMSGDAGASSFSITAGLTNAHSGTSPYANEAFVLERNVVFKSVTDGLVGYVRSDPTGTTTIDWARFHALGTNAQATAGFTMNPGTGTATISNSIQDLADGVGLIVSNTATGAANISWNVVYNSQLSTNGIMFQLHGSAGAVITASHCLSTSTRGAAWGMGILGSGAGSSYTDIRLSGISDIGVQLSDDHFHSTITDFTIRSGGNAIAFSGVRVANLKIVNLVAWRTNDGIVWGVASSNVTIDGGIAAGMGISNNACLRFDSAGPHDNITIRAFRCAATDAGHGSAGTSYFTRFNTTSMNLTTFVLDNITLGGSAPYANVATGALNLPSADNLITGYINYASTPSVPDSLPASLLRPGSRFGVQTQTLSEAIFYTNTGTLAYSTSTCDSSPCLKMTPAVATRKLESNGSYHGHGFLVSVTNGQTPTVSVKVQKDGSYAGNEPRLVLKANSAIGITADTVIDTMTVGTGSYETLTGTTAAVTGDGVLEFVVDCDGTAGNVYVDTWGVTGASAFNGALEHFAGALPVDGLKKGTPSSPGVNYFAGALPVLFNGFSGASVSGGFSPFVVF
jgi:hypothetical protein